ncbi:MAG: hypothetical protein ACTSWW_07225 [Promethearchaeota archaeon]
MNLTRFIIFGWEFESFEAFRNAFLGMQPINQILVFAALVALTVAAMILVYTVVKGTLKLVFAIFKWMFVGTKEVVIGTVLDFKPPSSSEEGELQRHRPQHHQRQHHQLQRQHHQLQRQHHHMRPPRAPRPPYHAPMGSALPPKTSQVSSSPTSSPASLHCPMCGEAFTKEMLSLLNQSSKTFCEYCGYQLEYVLS